MQKHQKYLVAAPEMWILSGFLLFYELFLHYSINICRLLVDQKKILKKRNTCLSLQNKYLRFFFAC